MDLFPKTRSLLTDDQKLRVFISSTLDELRQERLAVIKAISELKLHPVYFESGARPYPPREVYRAGIKQSHIFIGVYWESYGWVASGQGVSGIEDEFLLSGDKFKLIYIKNSSNERDPRLMNLIQKIEAAQNISYNKFESAEELEEKVKNDVMLLLSENFGIASDVRGGVFIGPSYAKLLDEEIKKKNTIDRRATANEIKELITGHAKILISGDPGIGKTYLLGQIARETDSLYISLKNKTVYQVCSNLANHLTIRRNLSPKNLFTEEDAKSALQEELANTSTTIILDDVDWNHEVYRSLMGLEFYDCHLVLACRALNMIQDERFHMYEIHPFSREEVINYLIINDQDLSPGELQRLFISSGGNPLYLYYFVNYQIFPLPEGLTNYHLLLWKQLQPLQKEILNLIAHSYASLGVSDFHALLNHDNVVSKTIMETEAIVDSIKPLTRIINKKTEIFHTYFEEFILETAAPLGIDAHYNLLLAEYALKKKWTVPSVVHLVRIRDKRADELVMQAISIALLSGDWRTCETLISYQLQLLENESDEKSEANARFFVSQVLYEIGHYSNSKIQLEKAKNLLEKLGDIQLLHKVEIWSNLIFIQDGQIDKSINGFKKGIMEVAGHDDEQEAIMQINLSYAYIQKSDFENGSAAAERALILFTKLSDERGRHLAILNLSCCVGGLGDFVLQKRYATDIISIAEAENNLRLKAAGLNHIAIVHRRADDYDKAEEVLLEAIQIAQQIGSFELEALNIANLGNVYLDQQKYLEAEKAYTESLNISKQHQLENQEARALELLSRLKFRRGEHKLSQKLAEDALKLHKKFGDPLRIATTLNYLGQANEELGNEYDAAENYEKSGDFYQDAKEWRDAAYLYRLATGLWNKLGISKNLQYCLKQGLDCAFRENSPTIAQDILAEVSQTADIENLDGLYEQIFDAYLALENKGDFSIFMQNFCSFCESYSTADKILMFKRIVFQMIEKLSDTSSPELINALATTISQASPHFFTLDELDGLAKNIAERLDRLYFRNLANGVRIWTIGTKWSTHMLLQIETLSEDNITSRISMALALFLFANNQFIEDDLKEFGEIVEDGVLIKIVTQQDFEANTGLKVNENDDKESDISHKDVQVSVTTTSKFDEKLIPIVLILHNDFETEANYSMNPGNKAYIWMLMLVYSGIVVHCLHEQRENVVGLANKSRKFCEKIFLPSKND